ncbi:hypothetical protein O3P69_007181 [Scylla paramamosain]|uniref:Uncharacterized protein n=1 Tax=Scylla paramamosain TaxID=85552 RepID=A0AAW0V2Y0_SCYPA
MAQVQAEAGIGAAPSRHSPPPPRGLCCSTTHSRAGHARLAPRVPSHSRPPQSFQTTHQSLKSRAAARTPPRLAGVAAKREGDKGKRKERSWSVSVCIVSCLQCASRPTTRLSHRWAAHVITWRRRRRN